jgi:hypothetical protein
MDSRLEVVVVPVSDINAACDDLRRVGAEVSKVFHDSDGVPGHSGSGRWRPAGRPTPGWLLQEITTRLPGR